MQAELEEKEKHLKTAQQEAENLLMQLSSEYSSIKELTRVYEKMEPSAAAKILLQYDDKDVVSSIIKNMSAPKAAEVLSEMDAPSAAQLLSRFDSRD